jgi:1-phosphofructokinase
VTEIEVVTVTANPAVDHTVWVPGFRAGEVNRVVAEDTSPGGKGVNVAAFLAALGVPVAATGLLGTRNAGLFHAFFEATGIGHCFVPVPGATRTGIKVVDDEGGTTTDLNFPGFTVTATQLGALEDVVAGLARPGRWFVFAGSLPPGAPAGLFRRLAEAVRGRGGRVAVDSSGPALAEAVAAGPDLLKPNRRELEELAGRALGDLGDVAAAARALGAPAVAVSMGADGALFARGHEVVFAHAPAVQVASTVGAGDAMVAGLVCAERRGLTLAEAAALATACSAVAISRVGPRLDAAAVEELAQGVEVDRVEVDRVDVDRVDVDRFEVDRFEVDRFGVEEEGRP